MRRALLLALIATSARAHTGDALEPHDLWTAWEFDPGVVIPLLFSAVLYARGARQDRGTTAPQMACFWSGWTMLVFALISPLHPLGEVLFSAHMVQHEILILVCAPLLVISRPLVPILWGFPFAWRRLLGQWSKLPRVDLVWRGLTRPSSAWWIHAAALGVWHVPAMFQATLTNEWMHAAQHLSFLLSALLFWWSLFFAHRRLGYGASILYVFTTSVYTSILGALLTLTPSIWYPAYANRSAAWGLNPLQDQQIGGLVMWIPGSVIYVGVALLLVFQWLRESEAMVVRRQYAP